MSLLKNEHDSQETQTVPLNCPWCGKAMEQGFLRSGRGSILWAPGLPAVKHWLVGNRREIRVDTKGPASTLAGYRTAWLCRNCEKMVFDMPRQEEPQNLFAAHGKEDREMKEGDV